MDKKKKKGFVDLIKSKIMDRKKEKRIKSGKDVPEWMKKLQGGERDKAMAVHKANKKRKNRY